MSSHAPSHKQGDRLSWGDTVFLHLEREGMPLNVADQDAGLRGTAGHVSRLPMTG